MILLMDYPILQWFYHWVQYEPFYHWVQYEPRIRLINLRRTPRHSIILRTLLWTMVPKASAMCCYGPHMIYWLWMQSVHSSTTAYCTSQYQQAIGFAVVSGSANSTSINFWYWLFYYIKTCHSLCADNFIAHGFLTN